MPSLTDSDLVCQWLVRARKALDRARLPLLHTFSNGKLEREMKFLMSAVAEQRVNHRSHLCLLEKKLFGCRIDLVAFERHHRRKGRRASAALWMETKCDFAEKAGSPVVLSRKTLKQIQNYHTILHGYDDDDAVNAEAEVLRTALINKPIYIVHFLNSLPQRGIYPDWVYDSRFKRNHEPLSASTLESAYTAEAADCLNTLRVTATQVKRFTATTEVAIVKLRAC
jgi:hypothetical protein